MQAAIDLAAGKYSANLLPQFGFPGSQFVRETELQIEVTMVDSPDFAGKSSDP
jgi:hypothetical protein